MKEKIRKRENERNEKNKKERGNQPGAQLKLLTEKRERKNQER